MKCTEASKDLCLNAGNLHSASSELLLRALDEYLWRVRAPRCRIPKEVGTNGSSHHSHSIETMLGLMAGTGIRIGESINVKIGDIKLDSEPPVLEIRVTKFQKSMLVPLRPTKRHVRVTAIVREAILKRDFTHWSVKFQRVNPPDAGKPIGANDFFTTDLV